MARKQKRYHYIYKTTCSITGRYYIGMHSTDKLEDEYIGSGRLLWLSINKYGRENHHREILEFAQNRQALKNREQQLVNEDVLKDPMCMNLMRGGEGGFISVDQQRNRSKAGGEKRAQKLKTDSFFNTEVIQKMTIAQKNRVINGTLNTWKDNYSWVGKKHTTETKKKMSESHKDRNTGELNSQYGTIWITNGTDNKKIKNSETIPTDWKNGRTIKRKSTQVVYEACLENK